LRPGTPSTGGSPIDPNNSLRGQQFLPGGTGTSYDQQARDALAGVQGGNINNAYDQQALARLNAVQGGNVQNQYDTQATGALGQANVSGEFSPMVGETRDMVMARLRGLGGPDRTQLAREAFDIFQQQNEPRYQQELRGVGQKAGALGRIGAGLTTNELTDAWSQRNRDLDLMQRGLINDAAGQTVQDRISNLNATLGGSQALEGQDFNRQNTNAQLALQRAGMLGQFGQNQFGRERSNADLGMQQAGMLGQFGQNQFGREATNADIGLNQAGMYGQFGRDEFGRGQANYQQNAQERAYQDYLARTALEDRVRQQQMEQQQAQQGWQNQFASNTLAAQIAANQQTGYPGQQPMGSSFDAGLLGGAQSPASQSYGNPGPQLPPPSDPTSIFSGNSGIGLQDPRRRGNVDVPSLFGDERLGLARAF